MATQSASMEMTSGWDVKKWAGWLVGCGIWFLPLIWIDLTTYLVLTVAGFTMGMLLFLTASGLTLIFGLMDVLNLAHGAFFVWGRLYRIYVDPYPERVRLGGKQARWGRASAAWPWYWRPLW